MSGQAILEVLDGGIASVQDVGRPGWAHIGVPPGGACDPDGLAVANALLDNPTGAAAVEVALGGFGFTVRETTVLALGGADLGAVVVDEDRSLAAGASHLVHASQTVRFEGRPRGLARGARAYLAVPGGFDVPRIMGSAATSLAGCFGGLDGRGLRAGDVLRAEGLADPALAGRRWPDAAGIPASTGVVRVVAGPHMDRFAARALDGFLVSEWTIRPDSDRMGIRLAGPEVPRRDARELVSLPMTWGAIQVPSDGTPIVLLADHQTVGGYPVLAVVIRADRPVIGQLAPGDAVSFELVDIEAAQAIWREDRAGFSGDLDRLAASERWTDQWRWAGA